MSETPMGACCPAIVDTQRLAAVARIAAEAHVPHQNLDALARLTAFAFKAPICVISLVEEDRVRFIGKFGLDAEYADHEDAICTHVVCSDKPMELLNLSVDEDFKSHPVCVGEPFVRAYCGHPIRSPEGLPVGAIAIVDTAPFFRFSESERAALQAAASVVERLLFGEALDAVHSDAAE